MFVFPRSLALVGLLCLSLVGSAASQASADHDDTNITAIQTGVGRKQTKDVAARPNVAVLDLPYMEADVSGFVPPKDQFAVVAGNFSASLCAYLGQRLPTLVGPKLSVNWTFGQYFPEGSNPSLELLVQTYPEGTFDANVSDAEHIRRMLRETGPDVDIQRDFGYGKANSRAAQNGPLGGLPAFCRVGGFVATSNTTRTFFEAWLPLGSDPNTSLTAPNVTDFPTESTPIYLGPDGEIVQGPPSLSGADSEASSGGASATPSMPKLILKRDHFTPPPPVTAVRGDDLLGTDNGWSGRILYVANSVLSGFLPFPEMKRTLSRYSFVALGSDAGHFGASTDSDWLVGPDREERILDWIGGRSHAAVLSVGRVLVDLFYGPSAGVRGGHENRVRSYVAGCSVGGATALNAIINFPDMFDGAIAGCTPINFTALNYAEIQKQKLHRPMEAAKGLIPNQLLQGPIRSSVLRQCDGEDGVVDGYLSIPERCKPNLNDIRCKGDNATEADCVTAEQIDNYQKLFASTMLENHEVYPRFFPGAEESGDVMTGSADASIDWLLLGLKGQSNVTQSDRDRAYADLITLADLQTWQKENIGNSDVSQMDLLPYFSRGGKLIHYHGLADLRVSPLVSRSYYEQMRVGIERAGHHIDAAYKYFEIPGMKHCSGGSGPWQMGGMGQTEPGSRPFRYDAESDIVLALIAWVEKGTSPEFLIGASYRPRSTMLPLAGNNTDDDGDRVPTEIRSYENGVAFTRKLCPHPTRAVGAVYNGNLSDYLGENAYLNFICSTVHASSADTLPPTSVMLLVFQVTLVLLAASVIL